MTDEVIVPGLERSLADGILTLRLNRPDKLNSLTFEVYGALRDLFAELERDDRVRVVVVTGAGRGFCSGGDVDEIIGKLVDFGAADMSAFARMTGDVVKNMRRLRKPIVAALNGTAAGAGAVIALAADLRVAARGAKLAFLFTKVGLTGADMGASFLLPRLVGLGRATELLLFGDPIAAEAAQAIGLVNEVVDPERLLDRARELALRLAAGPSFSIGMTKELLNNGFAMDLHTAIDAEARAQTICMLGEDFKEFRRAFAEKRTPVFRGR